MPEIGDVLFAVLGWDDDAGEMRLLSIHVTLLSAEQRACDLRERRRIGVTVVGPEPVNA